MRVVLAGATGLVGRHLWPLLVPERELLVVARRPSGAPEERLGPLDRWPALLAGVEADVGISTLGTTRRAAGSWAAFEAVDRHGILAFAAATRRAGARQFILVSSCGADPASRFPYLRLKGEVEDAIAAMGFARTDFLRPGLLLGARSERRLGEDIGQRLAPLVAPLLRGRLARLSGIKAEEVARAAAALVGRGEPGRFHHFNPELRALAEGA